MAECSALSTLDHEVRFSNLAGGRRHTVTKTCNQDQFWNFRYATPRDRLSNLPCNIRTHIILFHNTDLSFYNCRPIAAQFITTKYTYFFLGNLYSTSNNNKIYLLQVEYKLQTKVTINEHNHPEPPKVEGIRTYAKYKRPHPEKGHSHEA